MKQNHDERQPLKSTNIMKGAFKNSSTAGIRSTTLLNGIGVLAGAASGIILARSLGPAERGELAIAFLWPNILVLVFDLGLGFAFSYQVGKNRERLDDLWTLSLLAGCLLGITAVLLGWLLLPRLSLRVSGAAQDAMRIAFLTVPLILTTGYQTYLFLGTRHITEFNLVRLAAPVLNLFGVLIVAVLHRVGLVSYAIALLSSCASSFLLCTAIFVWRFRPRLSLKLDSLPGLFSYGIRTHVSSLASQTNLRLDQAVMSLLLAPEQLGQYVIAVAISGILAPLLNAFAVVLLPFATGAPDDASGAMLTARYIKKAILLSIPVLLVSVTLMPVIIPVLFGKGYSGAVRSAQILVVAGLFQGLDAILANSLRGLGRPGLPAVGESAGAAITVLLLYALLPPFGIVGAAVTSLAAYASVCLIEFTFIARAAGLRLRDLAISPTEYALLLQPRQLLRALVNR